MIESLGDSQYRRKSPRDALVRVVQQRIGGVVPRGLRLSVVIAHQSRRHGAVAAFEPRDIPVPRQGVPMLRAQSLAVVMPSRRRRGQQRYGGSDNVPM